MEFVALVPLTVTLVTAFVQGVKNCRSDSGLEDDFQELAAKAESLLNGLRRCNLARDQYRDAFRGNMYHATIRHLRFQCLDAEKEGWGVLGDLAMALPDWIRRDKNRFLHGMRKAFRKRSGGQKIAIPELLARINTAIGRINEAIGALESSRLTPPHEADNDEVMRGIETTEMAIEQGIPLTQNMSALMSSILELHDVAQNISIDPCDNNRQTRGADARDGLLSVVETVEAAQTATVFFDAFVQLTGFVQEMMQAFGAESS